MFCNPPYSDLADWVEKSYKESKKGTLIVMLIPARTDTKTFHKFILPYAGINSSRMNYAWAAGIIDGEGCIRVDKNNPTEANRLKNPSYSLHLGVKMTDFSTIEKLQEMFGGSITDEKRTSGRDLKKWEVYGERAKSVLEFVYPHLHTKQIQAQMGIEFQIMKSEKEGRLLTDDFLSQQEKFYQEISAIKKEQSRPGTNVEIRFIKGRLKFGDGKNSAPFPSMLVIFRR